MALAIDASVGGVSANSLNTLAEATAFFESRFNGGIWDTLTEDQQTQLLITAQIRLEQERYRGQKANPAQALSFPRVGITYDGYAVDSSTIPRDAKYAQLEEALAIALGGDTDILAASGTEGIESVDAGGAKITFRDPRAQPLSGELGLSQPTPADDASFTLAPQAYRLLRRWIVTGQRRFNGLVKLVRG